MKKTLIPSILLMTLAGTAQAGMFDEATNPSNPSGSSYARGEVLSQGEAQEGVVVSARLVQIEPSKAAQAVGTGGGAVAGAAVGSQVGKGDGKTLATLLGALAGGVAGNAATDSLAKIDGWELVVQTKSWGGSKLLSIVQATEPGQIFKPGDRVFLVKSGSGWNAPSRAVLAPPQPPALCDDAASEIKKSQREIERLTRERDRLAEALEASREASRYQPRSTPRSSTRPAPKTEPVKAEKPTTVRLN